MNALIWFLTGVIVSLAIFCHLHQNKTIKIHQDYFQMTFPGEENPQYWHLYTCYAYPSTMETTVNNMDERGAENIAEWRFKKNKVSFDNIQCEQQEFYK